MVYNTKFISNGSIEKFKDILVSKGLIKKQGINYNVTFSPVIKMNTIQIFISLDASLGYHIHQIYVKNEFLNVIFMKEYTWNNQLVLWIKNIS
jgi:hypothetical protein